VSAGAARRCGRCGRVRPISVRAGAAGPDICAGCYRAPEATCAGCGRCRPCTGIAAGRPICARCRPRRTRVCARCGLARPPATTWPEGPVCDPCYTAALRRRGPCSGCGRQRRLVAPPGPAATTCADCSDAPGPAGHVCADCGREDKLYARGRCARCSLRVRLDALLAAEGGQPPAALVGVRDAIVAAEHPRTALNWLRGGAGAPMLAALARGELGCSHEALDTVAARRAADYLRALLVAHGVLPARDEALARLERWVADLLDEVADAEHRRMLTAFATWRVLHRVRRAAERRPAAPTAAGHARLRLRAAVALVGWLGDRGIRLADLRQADLDRWLLAGPAVLRYEVRDFVTWAAARRLAPRLTLTRPTSQAGAATGEAERWALVHRLLHEPDLAAADRVAGGFLLLYAQQLSRIAVMTRDQVHDHGDSLSVRFGGSDLAIPEPLAEHVRAQLDQPRRHHSLGSPPVCPWLFPGHLPGRPITPARLGERLGRLGIHAQPGRRAALLQLAADVPAAVLADLLGIAVTTAADWAHAAGGDWSRYAAATARARAAHSPGPVEAS